MQRFARRIVKAEPRVPTVRVLLTIFATGWTVAAVAFWHVRRYETFLPHVWPIWFAATAVACWAYWLRPRSHTLYTLSGGMAFVGVLSRTAGVIHNLSAGGVYISVWYGVLGLVVYPLFALSLLFVWHVGFADLCTDRARGGG